MGRSERVQERGRGEWERGEEREEERGKRREEDVKSRIEGRKGRRREGRQEEEREGEKQNKKGVKREVASFRDALFSRYKLVGTHP